MRLIRFVLAMTLAALPIEAMAAKKVKNPTKYTYYSVSGSNAGQILVNMIRNGPRLGGVNAYATTRADFSQRGDMLVSPRSCKVNRFSFSGNYVINLPRLRNEGALQGPTRAAWNGFEAFLKKHEENHRAIWNQCSAELEARVRNLSAKNCRGVEAQVKKSWDSIRVACRKRHDQLDARDQAALLRQPLVRLALNQRAVVDTRTLKRKTKPKLRGLPQP